VTHSRRNRRRDLSWAVLTALILGGMPTPTLANGDSVTVSSLKAAFLFNFAKFSEWPVDALATGQRLTMCVVGDAAVADALSQTIKGHSIDGHELTVAILKTDAPTTGCHLLFVSASDMKRSSAMLIGLKGAAMLTVSDAANFAQSGGVAQLIVEGDHMRFAINLDAALRVRIRISSKLLALARIVKDDGDALHH
jgi:hypothetical protein